MAKDLCSVMLTEIAVLMTGAGCGDDNRTLCPSALRPAAAGSHAAFGPRGIDSIVACLRTKNRCYNQATSMQGRTPRYTATRTGPCGMRTTIAEYIRRQRQSKLGQLINTASCCSVRRSRDMQPVTKCPSARPRRSMVWPSVARCARYVYSVCRPAGAGICIKVVSPPSYPPYYTQTPRMHASWHLYHLPRCLA